MKASKENPLYSVYLISGNIKYNLTDVVEELSFSEQEKQIAKSVKITLPQVKVGDGWLSAIAGVRDRVFIYADDGERSEEVWRGIVWTRSYNSGLTGHSLVLWCYDNLIYFQESEDHEFFSAGQSTKSILTKFCDKWGISLDYRYESITHAKLALRGNLADLFTADVLDAVKERTGKKYVIRSDKDVMQVLTMGSNATVYTIEKGKNGIGTTSECTMDGMVTKVVILGKADDDDRQPVEATISGQTDTYGTLQKIVNRSTNTTLEDARKEAQETIREDGTPKWTYEVKAPDVPWLRKGDLVKVRAGDMTGTYLTLGVEREINLSKKIMMLTLEPA